MAIIVGLGPGALDSWESPYERDCYFKGTRIESQSTGPPNQQLTH